MKVATHPASSLLATASRTGRMSKTVRCYATTSTSPAPAPLPQSGKISTPSEYCEDLVRRLDPDAWMTAHFWPRHAVKSKSPDGKDTELRDMWLAWRAFNLELHQVQVNVKQPTIALMRYQFWRDALKGIWEDKPPNHPVALMLHQAKLARPVQRYYLKQMIDVRANSLSAPTSHPTLQAHLDHHAPLQNALLLGPLPLLLPPTHPSTSAHSHTLTHLSSLLTTTSLLRGLPLHVSNRRFTLPRDIALKNGLVEEQVFRDGGETKGLRDACFEIGTRGMDELITARSHLKETGGKVVPGEVMPLFLSAVPAERYLKRLEALDFNPFHPDLQKADWKLAPGVWWSNWTGKL
ncbi:isoprenoid synthase domain-containing protein [Filobasidium floriforme]|uniref:isoprenoid synthase domain-containing protein n=1 Tax=Filobasidium floriforme TaxID=5210 RepID=UPI001E8E14CA|nr:isoprenoid synthase domain-containing protein [Filobasidium floriforme]KAH8078235.1 isoprenoid synthase domain-containing protein [Filobasidium floriforme]